MWPAREIEGDQFPSLTPRCPQVHLFEREIAEQFGLKPVGHPWLKPVRYHRSWTGRDAWDRPADQPILPGVGDFYRVEGDEVHEVAVGPVHAGVIEPGHFRFQCHGEQVFHLEIALGFQHRGVEAGHDRRPDQALHPLCRDAGRRHDHRPRHRLLPGARSAGPLPEDRPRPDAARHRPGTGTPGQPRRRPGRAGQRCRLSAHRQLLRPHPRRFPQHDRAALRQPLRPRA